MISKKRKVGSDKNAKSVTDRQLKAAQRRLEGMMWACCVSIGPKPAT